MKKRLLLLTRTHRVAGAEKLIFELARIDTPDEFIIESRSLSRGGLIPALFGTYDVIHSHLFMPGLLIRLRRFLDSSFVWIHTVHYASYEGQRWKKLKNFLDKNIIFPGVDRLIAVSESARTFLVESLGLSTNISVIRNCVSIRHPGGDLQSALNFNSSPLGPKLRIGTTAMLRSEKGLTDLLLSAARLKQNGFMFLLFIAGEGPERHLLEKTIKRLNLQNEVELLGYVENVGGFLQTLDIYVNTSKCESFGISVLEAMSYKIPIVAAAVGELPLLLGNGAYGKLIPRKQPDFPEAFSEGIIAVSAQISFYKNASALGFQRQHRDWSPELFRDNYLALYRECTRPGVCMVAPIVTQFTGGIQKQLRLQTAELVRRGYRVFVLQVNDPALKNKLEHWQHVQFIQTPSLPAPLVKSITRLGRLNGVLFIVFGLYQIWRKRGQITIIHAHQLFSPTTIGFFAKHLFRKRLIVKVTASGAWGEVNELKRLSFRRFRTHSFRSIDRVVVLSEEMKSEMYQLGFTEDRISLIPNSVDVCVPHVEVTREKRPLRILYAGRLSKEKSVETLIEAGAILARRGVKNEIHLVGGASQGGRDTFTELRLKASQSPNDCEVRFFEPTDQIIKHYLEADVFVLPSISEGMSNALLEAMSHGLACVVSAIPANLFVVSPGHDGLSFELGCANDLAEQLIRLSSDKTDRIEFRKRLGDNAIATVRKRFSVEFVGSRLSELYRDVTTPVIG